MCEEVVSDPLSFGRRVHPNLQKTCIAAEAPVLLYTCVRHKHHTVKTCIFQGRLRWPLLTEGTQLSGCSEVINTAQLRIHVPHVCVGASCNEESLQWLTITENKKVLFPTTFHLSTPTVFVFSDK